MLTRDPGKDQSGSPHYEISVYRQTALASIDAMSQFNRALKRNLSAPEMAAFLNRVQALPVDAKRDAHEVGICLGGQRPT
jgi:hypothetical protein